MDRPLKSLKVLAVEQYGAGPFGTQHLADLGCEVIKVENRSQGGDYARSLGPHVAPGAEPGNDGLFFQALNRNKKSLSLDLGCPEGQETLHRLVGGVDAVANNLRGDVPEKLGLTFAALSPHNPAIVCAHCTAYGREGNRRNWPGYDYLMQAEAGYFHMSGEPDSPPTRMGLSVVDFMTGTYLALGLVAGVLGARETGHGRDIDVNLFDTALFNLSYLATWAFNCGYRPVRLSRSAHASLVPCQLYRTGDGWIYIMCNKAKFWPTLCRMIGHGELAEDPRFATFDDRRKRRDELTEILDQALQRDTTSNWLERFAGQVPAAQVRTPEDVLADPALAASGKVQKLKFESGGEFSTLFSPIAAGGEDVDRPCSPLGADTDEVLETAGFSHDDIAELRRRGVI